VLGDERTESGGEHGIGAFEVEHRLDVFGEVGEDFGEAERAGVAEGERPTVTVEGDGAEGLVVVDFEMAAVKADVDFDDVGTGPGGVVDQGETVAVAVGDEQGALVWQHVDYLGGGLGREGSGERLQGRIASNQNGRASHGRFSVVIKG